MKINQLQNQYSARNKRLKRKNINYLQFLRSDIWKITKKYFLSFKENQCCNICKSDKNLNIHHYSYVNIFKPSLRKRAIHLVTLCRDCHYAIHKLSIENNYGLRQAVKIYRKIYNTLHK